MADYFSKHSGWIVVSHRQEGRSAVARLFDRIFLLR